MSGVMTTAFPILENAQQRLHNSKLAVTLIAFRNDGTFVRERWLTSGLRPHAEKCATRFVRRFGGKAVVIGPISLSHPGPSRQTWKPCEHCREPIVEGWEKARLCIDCSEGLEQCARCRGPLDSDEGGNLYCLECDTCEDCLEPIIEGVSYHDAGCPVVVEE